MENDMDKMFFEFATRKQHEKETQDERDAKHKVFRDSAIKIIRETVAPVLGELSADLKRRGHQSEVSLSLEMQSYPSAQLSFQVVSSDPHSYANVSKLSFATTTSEDRMEVRKVTWGSKGKDESDSFGGALRFKLLADVTSDWVREQVFSFIGAVLKKQ